MIEGREDLVQWAEAKNGLFTVKAMYKALETRPSFPCPMKSI